MDFYKFLYRKDLNFKFENLEDIKVVSVFILIKSLSINIQAWKVFTKWQIFRQNQIPI